MPERTQFQERTFGPDSVRIRTVTGRTILRLKSRASGRAHIDPRIRIAGLDLPREVGGTSAGELRALCTGPSDWLLVVPGPISLPARDAIEREAVCQELALVDLSSGLAVLEVSGAATGDVLAQGCGLDARVFAPGTCARTRFAQIPAVIDFVQSRDRFALYVPRSLAPYLRQWLDDAGVCRFDRDRVGGSFP